MYRLGILSDSHNNRTYLRQALAALKDCDAICHLGDVVKDAEAIRAKVSVPVYSVRGNCDSFSDAPEEITLQIEGRKLLLCHGHRYRVKQSLTALSLRAEEAGADIVLFGHTHIPLALPSGRVLYINPGALMNGRAAILEFRPNGPSPVMLTL